MKLYIAFGPQPVTDTKKKKDLCGDQRYLLRKVFISTNNKSTGLSDSLVTQSKLNPESWGELRKY